MRGSNDETVAGLSDDVGMIGGYLLSCRLTGEQRRIVIDVVEGKHLAGCCIECDSTTQRFGHGKESLDDGHDRTRSVQELLYELRVFRGGGGTSDDFQWFWLCA